MQLTGPAFLLSVVESRWKPARQLILGVRPYCAMRMTRPTSGGGFVTELIPAAEP
jgi:hypothetical protein